MLPDGWSSYYLRDLFALTSGKSRPKKDLSLQATISKQYPVFGGNGIAGYTDEFLLRDQTIVIGRVGEYCGCVHLTQDACWVTDNTLYIRSFQSDLDLVFLGYLLKFLRLDRLRNKTGQPLVSQEPIYSLFVKLPPLPEQQKIAEILSSVDRSIALTQAVIAQTRKVKQGLLQQLLTRGIGHMKFKETAIGRIPENWRLMQLQEMNKPNYPVVKTGWFGSSMKTEHFRPHGIPVLTIQSLGEGEIQTNGLFSVDNPI